MAKSTENYLFKKETNDFIRLQPTTLGLAIAAEKSLRHSTLKRNDLLLDAAQKKAIITPVALKRYALTEEQ